jgi:glycosyltransferase involved in cell wall biosynthesis
MPRIVHICPRYRPVRGGVELFFERISEDLAARGDEVSVWTTDASTVQAFTVSGAPRLPPGPERLAGVDVRRFPVRYLPASRVVRTLAHLLPFGTRWRCDTLRWTPFVPALTRAASTTTDRVDLVHVAGLPYSSILFAGVRLAERTGARLVISPFTHVPPPGPAAALFERAYLSPLNIELLSRADRVFVQTPLERQALVGAGLRDDRLVEIGLGVDAEACAGGNRQAARARWGLEAEAVVVGHLANKSWDKGTVDLLDAAEALWARGVRFRLMLAGPEMASFRARLARRPPPDHLVDLGSLTDAERRDFYAAIDLFALPSYVESFGISSLEAALSGSAVVAYDHGGPSQIFVDDDTARLVPTGDLERLGDALAQVIGDRDLRARLAAAGARLARRYDWGRVFGRVRRACDDLLQKT